MFANHTFGQFRISKDPKLWYLSFLSRYPLWGSQVYYACNSERLIDWKDFCIHLVKQQRATQNFSFSFVPEEEAEEEVHFNNKSRKRKRLLYEQEEEDIEFVIDNYLRQQQQGTATAEEEEEEETRPFWIQDPLVVDIDRSTKSGIVATGKHRKNQLLNRSEHKILFWEYPNWKLKRTLELNLTPPNLTCQIIGIQSLQLSNSEPPRRFFALAIGMALVHEMDAIQQQQQGENEDVEDRVDIWKSIFVYQLFHDGSTQCVANIQVVDLFLGREIFLFSDTSWKNERDEESLQDWLEIISPKDAHHYNKSTTIFLLAIGPIYERITGCVQLSRFDLSNSNDILDPSITPVIWDNSIQQLVPLISSSSSRNTFNNPTEIITSIKLGTDVSCMIHFKYPAYLSHLICTGSYQDDELSVYDWRFGIKVGTLPWKTLGSTGTGNVGHINEEEEEEQQDHPDIERLPEVIIVESDDDELFIRNTTAVQTQVEQAEQQVEEEIEDDDEEEDLIEEEEEPFIDVRPWGLESTLVLPPYWTSDSNEQYNDDVSLRGFRLIAVGDNRSDHSRDKLEIKVWDISYLLQVKWSPFIFSGSILDEEAGEEEDLTHRFHWWPRRTRELSKLAYNMIQQEQARNNSNDLSTTIRATTTARLLLDAENNNMTTLTTTLTTNITNHHINNQHNTTRQYTNTIPFPFPSLPYSPPKGFSSMLLSHTFDKDGGDNNDNMIPVKYTAYNVLYTSLFLLTEDGRVTVMDIESGEITGQVENVALGAAASLGSTARSRRGRRRRETVRGIDVNVIAGKEVVVTSKEGLLRGIVN